MKVGRMQQAEFLSVDRAYVFPSIDDSFDQVRGIPLRRRNGVAFAAEPVFEQLSLSGLARTVRTFERDQKPPVLSLFLDFRTELFGPFFRAFCHAFPFW